MSSEISLAAPCFAPPEFPEGGRLSLSEVQVNANYNKQIREEENFKTSLSEQNRIRLGFTCSKSLHISFFSMERIIMNIMIPSWRLHLTQLI